MTPKAKRGLIILGGVVILFGGWYLFHPLSPEAEFRSLFKDLSLGVPRYQRFDSFHRPLDAVKGDFFSAEFTQSDAHFREYLTKLGVSYDSILSSNGVETSATSNIDTEYPWFLQIKAAVNNSPEKSYKIHIDGRQVYD